MVAVSINQIDKKKEARWLLTTNIIIIKMNIYNNHINPFFFLQSHFIASITILLSILDVIVNSSWRKNDAFRFDAVVCMYMHNVRMSFDITTRKIFDRSCTFDEYNESNKAQ